MAWQVTVAQIAAAPVAGLVGVWLGGFAQGRREDKRLDREERINREARLFDHRRLAYVEYLERAIADYNWAYSYVHGLGPHPETPQHNSFDDLLELAERVGIYGTDEAYQAARDLARRIMKMSFDKILKLNTKPKLQADRAAIDGLFAAFRAEVRKDLGVVDGGEPAAATEDQPASATA